MGGAAIEEEEEETVPITGGKSLLPTTTPPPFNPPFQGSKGVEIASQLHPFSLDPLLGSTCMTGGEMEREDGKKSHLPISSSHLQFSRKKRKGKWSPISAQYISGNCVGWGGGQKGRLSRFKGT